MDETLMQLFRFIVLIVIAKLIIYKHK